MSKPFSPPSKPEDPAAAIPVLTEVQKEKDRQVTFGIARVGQSHVGIPIDDLSEVYQVIELSPLLVKSSYLSGSFDLRGHLIPVLDLGAVCAFDSAPDGIKFAVVLRHAGRLLAILVDEVTGIVQVATDRLQTLEVEVRGCIQGAFLDKGRPVSVLDVAAMFALPGVFSVRAPQVASTNVIDSTGLTMLLFEVGGARFSVRAEDVYGTVPSQVIEVNAMTSRLCLGSITYHTRRVPVLCTVSVVGLGRKREQGRTEVVILRGPDEQLLGLAVDKIQTVQAIDPKRLSAIPQAIAHQSSFLSDVLITEDGGQIYTIATDRMLADGKIASIASLSSRAIKEQAVAPQDKADKGTLLRQVERYLVFQAGRAIAVPLSQVTSILQAPTTIVPVPWGVTGLEGYFSHLRDSIPLVNLNFHLGVPQENSSFCRVLLTGLGDRQVGFRVDRVHSIETSSWLLQGYAQQGRASEPLVQVGTGAARCALPVVDLARIAQELFGTPPVQRI